MRRVWLYLMISVGVWASDASMQMCIDNAKDASQMRECISDEYTYQDYLLNKYYKIAMKRIFKEAKEKFKKTQRAWIKYRDAKCDFESYESYGGTMMITLYLDCMVEMTKQRAEELRDIAYPNTSQSTNHQRR